ncbi:hypothetical protein ACPC54_23905 [Kitasatospora sp. NPDC094028]
MTVLLAWGDRSHWAHQARPCRYCGDLTHLRDERSRPSHKVCAEQASNPDSKESRWLEKP